MFELKIILGTISILIAFIGYFFYLKDVIRGKTKPHAYSWLVWSLLTGITFFGQILYKAGAGAWVTGFSAVVSLSIFILSLKKGEQNITSSDKISLFGAGLAIVLWYLTNNPISSIVLIMVIDTLGFLPTIRKSYHKPREETMLAYFLAGLKFAIALVALENYSVITYLYPAFLVFQNWAFTVMLIIRRYQHKKVTIPDQGF